MRLPALRRSDDRAIPSAFQNAPRRDDPYDLGYTRNTMAVNNEEQTREGEQNLKNGLSSDCRLQLACMKLELLVIADQHAAVNTFPGLVHTARHTMGVCNTRSP